MLSKGLFSAVSNNYNCAGHGGTLGRLRQEDDYEFKASLSSVVSLQPG